MRDRRSRSVSPASPALKTLRQNSASFKQRLNYEQTQLEAPKFETVLLLLDYADEQDQSLRDHSEDPDQENRRALER